MTLNSLFRLKVVALLLGIFTLLNISHAKEYTLADLLLMVRTARFGEEAVKNDLSNVLNEYGSREASNSIDQDPALLTRLCGDKNKNARLQNYINNDYYGPYLSGEIHQAYSKENQSRGSRDKSKTYYAVMNNETKQVTKAINNLDDDKITTKVISLATSIMPNYVFKEIGVFSYDPQANNIMAVHAMDPQYVEIAHGKEDLKLVEPDKIKISTNKAEFSIGKRFDTYKDELKLLKMIIHEIGHLLDNYKSDASIVLHTKEDCVKRYSENAYFVPDPRPSDGEILGLCKNRKDQDIFVDFYEAFWKGKNISRTSCPSTEDPNKYKDLVLDPEFATCYAKTASWEDFSESFAEYVILDDIKSAPKKLQAKLNFFNLHSAKLNNTTKPIPFKKIRTDIRQLIKVSEFCLK